MMSSIAKKYLPLLVIFLGLASIILGGVLVKLAADKADWMAQAAAMEKVTLGLSQEQIKAGEVVDSAAEMQAAADILREHRATIAPSYTELLAGGKYDPSNPKHLTYSQALNMENYLFMGVLGYGVTQVITATGAFMILVGLSLGVVGYLLSKTTRVQTRSRLEALAAVA